MTPCAVVLALGSEVVGAEECTRRSMTYLVVVVMLDTTPRHRPVHAMTLSDPEGLRLEEDEDHLDRGRAEDSEGLAVTSFKRAVRPRDNKHRVISQQ